MQAWGQTDTSETTKPVDAAGALRPGVLVDTFGKWEVRKGLIDNTYLLVGESAANGEGHFWLHCDQNNLITVAVPLIERTGSDRLRSHAITIRADTGLEREMSFIMFDLTLIIRVPHRHCSPVKAVWLLPVRLGGRPQLVRHDPRNPRSRSTPPIKSRIMKRSTLIDGRKTIVTIEDEFWARQSVLLATEPLDCTIPGSAIAPLATGRHHNQNFCRHRRS